MREAFEKAFLQLLREERYTSQSEICQALNQKGFKNISQSKISRMLARLGAARIRNSAGEITYCLPVEISVPATGSSLKSLVLSVKSNSHIVVVRTSPGAAQLIARMLDSHGKSKGILGTIAGDDTVFVSPVRGMAIDELHEKLESDFFR